MIIIMGKWVVLWVGNVWVEILMWGSELCGYLGEEEMVGILLLGKEVNVFGME